MQWTEKVLGIIEQKVQRMVNKGLPLPPPDPSGSTSIIRLPEPEINLHPIDSKEEALSSYAGWVYAAASTISWDCRVATWSIWNVTGDEEEMEQLPRKQVPKILMKPNSQMNWGDLVEITQLNLDLTGEAFWHMMDDEAGRFIGIQFFYSHWVDEPTFNDDKTAQTGWKVTVPGKPQQTVAYEDVIFFKYPHPMDPYRGASPVEAFAVSYDLDAYARAYGAGLLKNFAQPTGYLSSEQILTPDQATQHKERWKDSHLRKPGEIAVLGAGLDFKAIGLPLKDLEFLTITRLPRDQIFAIYKVPASKLGLSEDVNRTDSEAHERSYQKNSLEPRLKRYEVPVNEKVMPKLYPGRERTTKLFLYDSPVQVDKEFQLKENLDEFEAGGITLNEFRQSRGHDPVPDGDVYLIKGTVDRIPAGQLQSQPERKEEQRGRKQPRTSHLLESVAAELAELKFLRGQEPFERVTKAKTRARFAREHQDIKKALRENWDSIQRILSGKVVTLKDREWIKETLKWIKEHKGKELFQEKVEKAHVGLGEIVTRDWLDEILKEQSPEWNKLLGGTIGEGVREGWLLFEEEGLGSTNFSLVQQKAKEFASRTAGHKVVDITDRTLKDLRKMMGLAVEEGWALQQTQKQLALIYDDYKGYRAERIARTETAASMNYGKDWNAQETAKRNAIEMLKSWVPVVDGSTRKTHLAAGKTTQEHPIPVTKKFEVGDALLSHPGDYSALVPEETINCRCTMTYSKKAS